LPSEARLMSFLQGERRMAGGRLSFDRLPWCTGRVYGGIVFPPQVATGTRLPP
jgi:hypothetical protein